ncbi:MAG: DUF72 domain-containing protein [Candidatus Omnitrophica bacterium]|nr:DUF72 domain-containing protein [Candidatus Omnitrophota bacterium]
MGIHIGCSGWDYKHWQGLFYPEGSSSKSWFKEYSSVFSTVEINNTFYRLPAPSVFGSWREQAQPGFIYAVKASRFITHMKKLRDAGEPVRNFLDRARLLGDRLGPVLFQLPPHWGVNAGRLAGFISGLPGGFRYVFEFRDSSWYSGSIYDILSAGKTSMCLHDMAGSESPIIPVGDICYIRFHGTSGKYAGGYPVSLLRGWIEFIRECVRQKKEVYVYFNNDAEARAPEDALRLIGALHDLYGEWKEK